MGAAKKKPGQEGLLTGLFAMTPNKKRPEEFSCPYLIISSMGMETLQVCVYETEPAFTCRPGFGT